jgi:hypothetical protein
VRFWRVVDAQPLTIETVVPSIRIASGDGPPGTKGPPASGKRPPGHASGRGFFADAFPANPTSHSTTATPAAPRHILIPP